MSAHTPGPWTRWVGHAEVYAGSVIENSELQIRIASGGRGLIADCSAETTECPLPEAIANARLMAAAPELFEACREAIRVVRTAVALNADVPGFDVENHTVVAKLRSAIAKAEP